MFGIEGVIVEFFLLPFLFVFLLVLVFLQVRWCDAAFFYESVILALLLRLK